MTLYKDKKECCGCAACKSICPQNAIKMVPDEDGFLYPQINDEICVECGSCKKVCISQSVSLPSQKKPIAVYAAVNKNQAVLKSSSSGGVFAAVASIVLKNKGVIFGCTMNMEMEIEHIGAETTDGMKKLQGSKYVQSDVRATFSETKRYLQEGRQVLYTGTPCQIAGLKSYIEKDHANLITVDLICHGVPSPTLFKGYINWLGKRQKGKVIDYKFRDKSKAGMGCIGKVKYQKDETIREEEIIYTLHSYYYYFMRGDIYRECCYQCKYACSDRQGDFTMGDYWGVEKAHPEINTESGISVLLVNSEKGILYLDKVSEYLNLTKSTFDKACSNNGNLVHPTNFSIRRNLILKAFREEGYAAVDDLYRKAIGQKMIFYKMKAMIPESFKRIVKILLSKLLSDRQIKLASAEP